MQRTNKSTLRIWYTSQVENFALLFNKLLPKIVVEVDIDKNRNRKKRNVIWQFYTEENDTVKNKVKSALLKKIQFYSTKNEEKRLIKQLVETYKENQFDELKLKTGYHLAVGLGLPSFFENGLTLHHIYGTPYIPGSSVKGLARFTFLTKVFNIFPFDGLNEVPSLRLKNEEEPFKELAKIDKALVESKDFEELHEKVKELLVEDTPIEALEKFYYLFKDLFGTQSYRGRVIFVDAFATEWKFKVDIMNPHYQEYYQSESDQRKNKEEGLYLVGDWHNPTPIFFLTVDKGALFSFLYKVEKPKFNLKGEEVDLKKLVEELLKEGLSLLGIGGKKGKGYGWFEKENKNPKTA